MAPPKKIMYNRYGFPTVQEDVEGLDFGILKRKGDMPLSKRHQEMSRYGYNRHGFQQASFGNEFVKDRDPYPSSGTSLIASSSPAKYQDNRYSSSIHHYTSIRHPHPPPNFNNLDDRYYSSQNKDEILQYFLTNVPGGSTMDYHQKKQIYDLLYSNKTKFADDARQLAGLRSSSKILHKLAPDTHVLLHCTASWQIGV